MTKRLLKHRIAAMLFPRYSALLDRVNYNALVLNWIRRNRDLPAFPTREYFYEFVHRYIGGAIDYLEFGVFQGESLRSWTQIDSHPESRFYGFDSFKGLGTD